MPELSKQSRHILLLAIVGLAGAIALPWYVVPAGFWAFAWIGQFGEANTAPLLLQALLHGRWQLLPIGLCLLIPLIEVFRAGGPRGTVIAAAGGAGLFWMFAQGLLIGLKGWNATLFEQAFGPIAAQTGFGVGAVICGGALLLIFSSGLALNGLMRGDGFLVSSIAVVASSIGVFVFYPVFLVLIESAVTPEGSYSLTALVARVFSADVGQVTLNSLALGIATGLATTLLGLGLALLHKRTNFRAKGLLRLLAILPIITPPFVIGLGIILLFGRNGVATWLMSELFGIPPSRWIYGFFGLLLVQTLAFAPIAYLVIIGVVEGISPSMEEASQTLRANRWQTFANVTWPLMRPGLANAFLIGFVESLADFGNPLVLGGNYDVLSTDIFFAIVGSQNDPGRAAALSIALLSLTLSAFYLQRRWLGRRSYTTISGKGDF